MTAEIMLADLTEYFSKGKYSEKVLHHMRQIIESIGDEERALVIEHMIETQKASFQVGVSDIVESCKALGIGFRAARFVPAMDWVCDACGHQFKYTQAASDDDKIDKNMHDACPMCGMQPNWTITARGYKQIGGDEYRRIVNKCAAHRTGDASAVPFMDGGFIYFNRAKAEKDRREAQQVNIEKKLDELDQAKRWDMANR